MTNEEKATEIGTTIWKEWNDSTLATGAEKGAKLMAEWKDEQFREYLKKKEANTMQNPYSGHCPFDMRLIDEIINDLFPNTEQDNSENDE